MPAKTDTAVLFNFDSPIFFGEIFGGLADEVRESISEITKGKTYSQGQFIFSQGELSSAVIRLEKGEAVLICSTQGERHTRHLEKDEIVGLTELLADVPLDSSLISKGETAVTIIPASEFIELIKKENLLCFRLLQVLSSRYRTKLEYFSRPK